MEHRLRRKTSFAKPQYKGKQRYISEKTRKKGEKRKRGLKGEGVVTRDGSTFLFIKNVLRNREAIEVPKNNQILSTREREKEEEKKRKREREKERKREREKEKRKK